MKNLKLNTDLDIDNWFFCFEHTGVYSYELLLFLQSHEIACLEESVLRIKNSLGLKRGKNDKADSKTICQYAFEKKTKLNVTQPVGDVVAKIKRLVLRRNVLVNYLKALKTSYKATRIMSHEDLIPLFDSHQKELVSIYERQIKELEQQMKIEIARDPIVKKTMNLLNQL